jgi:N-acetylmuramoyl-L-alanine amidase
MEEGNLPGYFADMNPRLLIGLVFLPSCAGRAPGPGAGEPPLERAEERPGPTVSIDTQLPSRLPPIPATGGPLRITVVYPDSNARVAVRDSSFLFGSVGDGRATLRINGQPIPVAANGAWLAWVPFRGDSVIAFTLEARSPSDSARMIYRVRRAPRFNPSGRALWIDTTTLSPTGRVWWPRDEFLPLSVRASEGARLELHLPGRRVVPLVGDSAPEPVPEAVRAFDRDPANLVQPVRADRYSGAIRGLEIAEPPARRAAEPPSRRAAPVGPLLLAIRGKDTLRVAWPLRISLLDTLPVVVELDPDRTGATDGLTKGRTVPGGTYTWFFPAGTRARVRGRINEDLRIGLSRRSEAWVPAREARPAAGPTEGVVGSLTLTPLADRVVARIPVGVRVPYLVGEDPESLTLLLYGARSDVNWLRYGREDSLVTLVTTQQRSADELEIRFRLHGPVWGYRARWEGTDLLFEIRRPPVISSRRPLAGLTIALDPGHPPLGATGPTGLAESEANLLVAQQLAPLLEREGARAVLTRTDARPLALVARVPLADSAGADLLVSIHNNALPDGVNPFTNNGASVFYNHPRALPLARAIQSRLVARTGLRDLGVARGDLALTRATWMPAVLTEGMFLMIPEQESALRSSEGRRLYALAVLEGIRSFLATLAR